MKFSKRILVCLLAVAMLLGCFPSLGATAETTAKSNAGAGLTTAYDALYVQDGLVMLLSAYDQAKAGLVSEGGMYTGWTNKVDGTVATFHNYTDASNSANNIWWKLREGKGVGYDLTAAQHGSGYVKGAQGLNAYLYLGDAIVDVSRDYTVEYASSLLRVSENGVQVNNGGNFHNTASNTEKFGAWGTWVYRLNQADSLRPTYNPDGLGAENYGNSHTEVWTISAWANSPSAKTASNVITVDLKGNNSFRDFYSNGEARSYTSTNGKVYSQMSIKQNNTQEYSTVITSATEFWMMRNCANTTYAVRVYDRALSAEEIEWNTLIDIAAYVGADVSPLANYSETQRIAIASKGKGLTFDSSKADVENAIAAGIAYLDSFAFTEYDALYVQDGLVMLLSAYDHAKAGLVQDGGAYTGWINKVNSTAAALHNHTNANAANNVWWKTRNGKGIGYDLTEAQYRNGNNANPNAPGIQAYLYLGNGIVDVSRDYTVEYASSLLRISENGAQVNNGGDYYNISSGTEKFGAWGTWVMKLNNAGDSLRPTYSTFSRTEKYGENKTDGWNISVWANDPSVKTSSNVITVDVAEDSSFRNFYANGEHSVRMSIKQNVDEAKRSVITSATEFWLMQNCANTLYAVRVYDRALSAEEIEWNTLIDIAAYVGADVSPLTAYDETQRLAIAFKCKDLTFASTKADVESAIAAGIAYLDSFASTEYDALYVQEGLVMLLSAYDHAKAGLVQEGGAYTGWINKVNGTVATLHNYTDANAANNIWWKTRGDKGIGYDLTAAQHGSGWAKGAQGLNAYLYLGDAIVDVSRDYTVEYASSLLRVSENGVQVDNGGDFHNTASNAEKFGAWGTWIYRLDRADSLRPTYNPDGLSAENYGNSTTEVWTVSAWANSPSAKTTSNVITVDLKGNNSFRDFYSNGEPRSYTGTNGNVYSQMSIKQNNNQTYNTVITSATEFWMMRNCANTTYAVRVYDRALSAEEVKYNAAVDTAAYYDLDVSILALFDFDADDLQKTCFVDLATYGTDLTDTSELQAIVDAAVVEAASSEYGDDYALSLEAEGRQISKDGDSLRIWASVKSFDNVSKLGMAIVFKQDGEVIYSGKGETQTAFLSITTEFGSISAESMNAAGLYAAAITGFAAGTYDIVATPYAVLMDGSVVIGQTVRFGEWFSF